MSNFNFNVESATFQTFGKFRNAHYTVLVPEHLLPTISADGRIDVLNVFSEEISPNIKLDKCGYVWKKLDGSFTQPILTERETGVRYYVCSYIDERTDAQKKAQRDAIRQQQNERNAVTQLTRAEESDIQNLIAAVNRGLNVTPTNTVIKGGKGKQSHSNINLPTFPAAAEPAAAAAAADSAAIEANKLLIGMIQELKNELAALKANQTETPATFPAVKHVPTVLGQPVSQATTFELPSDSLSAMQLAMAKANANAAATNKSAGRKPYNKVKDWTLVNKKVAKDALQSLCPSCGKPSPLVKHGKGGHTSAMHVCHSCHSFTPAKVEHNLAARYEK